MQKGKGSANDESAKLGGNGGDEVSSMWQAVGPEFITAHRMAQTDSSSHLSL